jgi:hydroxymethylpyrimidine pyrophosphatase-like HAD family hydrolase
VIAAIYAMFESNVHQLLDYAKNKEMDKLSVKSLKTNGCLCSTVNLYMNEVLNLEFKFDSDDIKQISNLYLVRNIMVHENGYVGGDHLKKQKIEDLKEQYGRHGLSVIGQQVKLNQNFLEFYFNQIEEKLSKLMRFLEEKYNPFDREVSEKWRESFLSTVSQVKKQNGQA